ncbi:ATP-binding protein [Deinococcus kurensis]|uniref:ATP-binding protein n=1 Tax=Deinococcus kurensis TaxID=2662757 RepID=UPI0012D2C280|nr:ATP-binding protein [Deinococcus kurensis]
MAWNRRWTLLCWVAVALLGTWVLTSERRAALRASFDLDARVLHRLLSQRMEQQETVLYALAALPTQGMQPDQLTAYVRALVRPYPQIVAVEFCAEVCRALVATQARPDLPYVPTRRPVVGWPAQRGPTYALTLERVRVWINLDRLVQGGDLARLPLTVQIYRPGDRQSLLPRPPVSGGNALVFTVDKQLGTTLEPFPIRFEQRHSAWPWPWRQLLGWWLVTALLAWGAARLLSARAVAAQALLDERRRAQGVVQASTDGIVVLDPQGTVVQVNPAARRILSGLHLGESIRGAAQFQATLAQAPLDAADFWATQEPQPLPEGTALLRGTERVLVEGGLAPLTGDRGQLLGRVLTVREIGPLQQRMLAQLSAGERRVREHEQLLAHVSRFSTLGEMSAGLAHELNQPLTAIVSYGQGGLRLLAQEHPDRERVQQAVQAMVRQAQRASDIITRLRALVRRSPTQRVKVDLGQAARNILTLCQADLGRLGVEVDAQLPGDAPVAGDPVQIEQIILNLVRNALDALAQVPQRRLTLRVDPDGAHWVLSVQDSGPGLSGATLTHLFQPFHTDKPDGLGLGLSLSQTLAQGLGGELRGDNAPGGGARFTLSLPHWEHHDPTA